MAALSISTPDSQDGSLSLSTVASWEASIASDPKARLARTVLSHSGLRTALTSRIVRIADPQVFNTVIDFKTAPITNQGGTGRCWLFAATNVLRYDIMRKLKLKEFQLSHVRVLVDHLLPSCITDASFF